LRAADDERRKARQTREETERRTRDEAERIVAELRSELETARRGLERGQLTAPAIDTVLERAEDRLARVPAPADSGKGAANRASASAGAPGAAADWRIGDEARSRSGGWSGTIAALDRSRRRATIEAGAMRVSVSVADLERVDGAGAGSGEGGAARGSSPADSPRTNTAALQLSRANSVPMSLDLRGARVDEALAALERYLEDASLAGLERVTVIHGMGTGALRDAVRTESAAHELVRTIRPGERGEGGDGVTVVDLG
jgi:DNA mismatch repair protein MutS2